MIEAIAAYIRRQIEEGHMNPSDTAFAYSVLSAMNAYLKAQEQQVTAEAAFPSWITQELDPKKLDMKVGTVNALKKNGVSSVLKAIVLEKVIQRDGNLDYFRRVRIQEFNDKWPPFLENRLEEHSDDLAVVNSLREFGSSLG